MPIPYNNLDISTKPLLYYNFKNENHDEEQYDIDSALFLMSFNDNSSLISTQLLRRYHYCDTAIVETLPRRFEITLSYPQLII